MKTTVIGVMRTHLDDKFISVKNENMPEIFAHQSACLVH